MVATRPNPVENHALFGHGVQSILAATKSGAGRRPSGATHTPPNPLVFRGTNSNTYYSPSLIRAGIQTIQQLMAMGGNVDFLPRTWAPVYKDVALTLLHPPPPHHGGPSDRAATHGNQTSFRGSLE